MTMTDWAEKEIEIFKDGADGYMCACADSALKAYKTLSNDEHSGCSWEITKSILIKLMNGRPLTPITEKDFENVEPKPWTKKDLKLTQCPRMSSLFRHEVDGKVTYSDVDRVISIDTKGHTWQNGFISNIVDKKYPIKLPYSGEKYKAYIEDWYEDENGNKVDVRGEYNRLRLIKIVHPDGTVEEINKTYEV